MLPKFLSLFLKPTRDSKTPTDIDLDECKEKLAFNFQYDYSLLKHIMRHEIMRFFVYRWKLLVSRIVMVCVLCVLCYYAFRVVEPMIIRQNGGTSITEKIVYIKDLRPFSEFVSEVGEHESGNHWNIVSKNSMLGYFQFSKSTLRGIGIDIDKIGVNTFLKSKDLQIAAFKLLLNKNRRYYKEYIDRWDGRRMKDFVLTESGLLMMFHLKPDDAIQYLNSSGDSLGTGDGNGTTVEAYGKYFSGYMVELN